MRLTSVPFRSVAAIACSLLVLAQSSTHAVDRHIAGDLYIEEGSPRLNFVDSDGFTYRWSIFPDQGSFDIQDNTVETKPFRIWPGPNWNALVIDSSGRIGMGTPAPARDLHIYSSDTPIIRLSEDGLTQDWDIGCNDFGFFIDDVDAGTQPFAIKPGASSNSLVVSSIGNVGIGTASPGTRLHVLQASYSGAESITRFSLDDDSIGKLEINNATTTNGTFIPRLQGFANQTNAALIMEGVITGDSGTGPAIVYNARTPGSALQVRPLVVYRNNNVAKVTIAANGNVTATSFTTASSRTLKDNIVELESKKALETLRQLNPVEFTYKDDPTADNRIGFIAEDVPSLVAESHRQSVPVMDVLAVVTRVVKDQQKTIDQQKTLLAEQDKSLDDQRRVNDEQRKLNERLIRELEELESQESVKK